MTAVTIFSRPPTRARERRMAGASKHKLDALQVREIRALAADPGITQAEIARRFGISQPAVSFVLGRRRWGYVE